MHLRNIYLVCPIAVCNRTCAKQNKPRKWRKTIAWYIYLLTFNRNEEDHKTDMEKWFTSGGFIVVIRLYIYMAANKLQTDNGA